MTIEVTGNSMGDTEESASYRLSFRLTFYVEGIISSITQ